MPAPNDDLQGLAQRLIPILRSEFDSPAVTLDYGAGTAFPTGVPAGAQFFRTDLGWRCYYDGTRWLTVHEDCLPLTFASAGTGMPSYSAAANTAYLNPSKGLTPYFTALACHTNVTAPNSGAAFWSVFLQGLNLAAAASTGIISFDTSADTAAVRTNHSALIPAANALPTNTYFVSIQLTKTGAPGNLEMTAAVFFRYVVP